MLALFGYVMHASIPQATLDNIYNLKCSLWNFCALKKKSKQPSNNCGSIAFVVLSLKITITVVCTSMTHTKILERDIFTCAVEVFGSTNSFNV